MLYQDREEAGKRLTSLLTKYKDLENVLVLALPRGGVIVGHEVSKFLNCPLDIIIIKKIGYPGEPEFAIGAISETGTIVYNERIISIYNVPKEYIETETSKQKNEILESKKLYRGGKDIMPLDHKNIILVDDGIATGATIKAAIFTLKKENISKLIVAIPVSSKEVEEEIKNNVDECICPETPEFFTAVGNYYKDFTQVSHETVIEILKQYETDKK